MALYNIVKGGVALLGIGALVSGAVQITSKLNSSDNEEPKIRLSRILDSMQPMRDALLAMSENSRADLMQLERVGRRCASLLDAYLKVMAAQSTTVRAAIITLGSRYTDSIKYHLYEFYKLSDILLVEVDKQMVPMNLDLKHAHESLINSVECLAQSLEIAAREKIEQGVAERV